MLLRFDESTQQMVQASQISADELYEASLRNVSTLVSCDLDGDGIVEIPTQPDEAGLLNLSQSRRMDFIVWMDYTSRTIRRRGGAAHRGRGPAGHDGTAGPDCGQLYRVDQTGHCGVAPDAGPAGPGCGDPGRGLQPVKRVVSAELKTEERPWYECLWWKVMLPGMNGFSLCETIRRTDQKIGIIILSAKGQEQDKIRGLSIGADDYMTKPFSVSELLARVEALCRRVHRAESEEEQDPAKELGTLTSGDFVLDENRRVLLKAGQPIELTQVEFQIMELFFRNPGIALVREKILKGVWGENYFGDVKIVDVNIRRLRMKVEDEPSHPTHIMTVWGYGYRWEE